MQHDAIGFFGKLPAYGDFIHRNLPSQTMAAWDEWLKSYVGATQERLGDDWLDIYLTSPVWRFAFSAGVLDEKSWVGILIPSVDRVGRYFPFSLLCPLPENISPAVFMSVQEAWFQDIEDIGLNALDGALDAEQVLENAQQVAWQAVVPYMIQSDPDVQAGLVVDMPDEQSAFVESAPHMLDAFIRSSFKSYSLWSTTGSERVAPCMFAAQGLPPVSGGSAMMDGLWEDWEWSVPWRLTGEM